MTPVSNHITPVCHHVTPLSNHVTPVSYHVTPVSDHVTQVSHHVICASPTVSGSRSTIGHVMPDMASCPEASHVTTPVLRLPTPAYITSVNHVIADPADRTPSSCHANAASDHVVIPSLDDQSAPIYHVTAPADHVITSPDHVTLVPATLFVDESNMAGEDTPISPIFEQFVTDVPVRGRSAHKSTLSACIIHKRTQGRDCDVAIVIEPQQTISN